jgi:GWxTD domain-containing protein
MQINRCGLWLLWGGLTALLAAACGGASGIALDPASRDFYETARLIMSGEERDIFNHLPDQASRQEFVADFWAKRDPDPSTEVNEFKQEFEARIDYANKHFREGRKGIDTDRGRMYLYLGPPDKTELFPFNQTEEVRGPILWWIYYGYELGIEFIDAKNMGAYTINEVDGNLSDAIERAKMGAEIRSGGKFVDFGLRYDLQGRALLVTVPVKRLSFKEEGGRLSVEMDFQFYIYGESEPRKSVFSESRTYSGTPAELETVRTIVFKFPYDLPPGRATVDVLLTSKDLGRFRKIFRVKG